MCMHLSFSIYVPTKHIKLPDKKKKTYTDTRQAEIKQCLLNILGIFRTRNNYSSIQQVGWAIWDPKHRIFRLQFYRFVKQERQNECLSFLGFNVLWENSINH